MPYRKIGDNQYEEYTVLTLAQLQERIAQKQGNQNILTPQITDLQSQNTVIQSEVDEINAIL